MYCGRGVAGGRRGVHFGSPVRCRCWSGRTPDDENAGTTTGSPVMGLSQRQQIGGPYAPLIGPGPRGTRRRSGLRG